MPAYDPSDYWSSLHARGAHESTVGYPELADSLNAAMYRSTERSVTRALTDAGVDVAGGQVLDIGSGTGIWIDYWQRRGAARLTGVDLAEQSVQHLRVACPGVDFARVDIGDADAELPEGNDVVSAMSILLHIVDADRFRRAIANLAGALRPGGVLVAIEPVVVHHWWGPSFGPEATSRARPLREYEAAFADAGLELQLLRPATVLLSNVVDTRAAWSFRVLQRYWSLVMLAVGRRESLGRVAAGVLEPLDGWASRRMATGPSAKVLIARRAR